MEQLWEQLRALGVAKTDMPTARTLENWRAEGLVSTRREFLGRGHGSRSEYVEGTAAKVVELIGLLKESRSFDQARLVLFYRGHDIEEGPLKRSYLAVLQQLRTALRGPLTTDELTRRIETGRDKRKSRRRLAQA